MDTSKTIDKWIIICSDNNRNCQVKELKTRRLLDRSKLHAALQHEKEGK